MLKMEKKGSKLPLYWFIDETMKVLLSQTITIPHFTTAARGKKQVYLASLSWCILNWELHFHGPQAFHVFFHFISVYAMSISCLSVCGLIPFASKILPYYVLCYTRTTRRLC